MQKPLATLGKLFAAATLVLAAGCEMPGLTDESGDGRADRVSAVTVQFGDDVPGIVRDGVAALLGQAHVRVIPAGFESGSLVLAIGETPAAKAIIANRERDALGAEGFILRSGLDHGAKVLAARGAKPASGTIAQGSAYAAYAALEELGFAFLHPLRPLIPAQINSPGPINRTEVPRWQIRGTHIHTMHPLELTDLLNGYAGGKDLIGDDGAFTEGMKEWNRYLEWAVANRQNRVEWVLLRKSPTDFFANSAMRRARLGQLVRAAHDWGIKAGIDAPIELVQQHAWTLVRDKTPQAGQPSVEEQITSSLDWLLSPRGANFDFLATELGNSEFSHDDPKTVLSKLNLVTEQVASRYGKQAFVKVHASTGQDVPRPGARNDETINFNFLPQFADPRLGVMPHTVELYSLDDPAPTYGNHDFKSMRTFLNDQRRQSTRPVVWHPETAYWVSYDIDVPLFLPLYAERRLHDLRLLAEDERTLGGRPMGGQMNFSSGWEWGYWLNDVVTARAAWDPLLAIANGDDAFEKALAPVVHPFGPKADEFAKAIAALARDEEDLLVLGKVKPMSEGPRDVEKLNGQAYMQGWETFDDLSTLLQKLGKKAASTQPAKLGLPDTLFSPGQSPGYRSHVEPLLAAMEERFGERADQLEKLADSAQLPETARPLAREIAQAARMTALRATQLHGLYDYVDAGRLDHRVASPLSEPKAKNGQPRNERLDAARTAFKQALVIVGKREKDYRVPVQRIAGWRDNPTAYQFGYLWTVHNLFYWLRDDGKAVNPAVGACYMNIIDPIDVGLGQGNWTELRNSVEKLKPLVFDNLDFTRCIKSEEDRTEPSVKPSFLKQDAR
jgi:hypothetical protein